MIDDVPASTWKVTCLAGDSFKTKKKKKKKLEILDSLFSFLWDVALLWDS